MVRDSAGEEHSTVTMKGISTNKAARTTLNDNLFSYLLTHKGEHKTVPQFLIKRDFMKTTLASTTVQKQIRFHSTKRWFLPDPNPNLKTLPFGYVEK